ncbi:MAG: glutamine amidotransferase [Pseudomonadota bacterium]|nr:glutamine amidotransferase [Pseudomonadota bacterium]
MRPPFLILQTGHPTASMRRHGSFAHWIRVAAGLRDDDAVVINVVAPDGSSGEPLPAREGFAGVIVTGSGAMVTELLPWSEASAAWLHDAAHAGLPLLGICYGHQLIAHALGGQVGYNPLGREMGTVDITLQPDAGDDPLFAGLPSRFTVQSTHLQTVLALPEGARLVATSKQDAACAFRWGQSTWGVQFHPEFSTTHMRGYIWARRDALAVEGLDAEGMARAVRGTPLARQLLRRFVAFASK